ncbi:11283_t:CDS:2 [Entrophospora sp. SA101]|nr:11283_t:CDS:2 [Entrophospora sp. SA101]CAJ0837406.1 15961_t:CDS:2 [Entrophospora sp. SA101]CAJ0852989.1 16074_t:CDS:2 [Entrophospora sp. SA101]CAJ0853934.1 2942_t:CDS:2 [Entrophospora sp. SA101]
MDISIKCFKHKNGLEFDEKLDLEIYNKIRPVSSVLKIHIYSRFTLNKGKFHKGALSAFHGFLQLLELFHPHESFAKILSTNPEIHRSENFTIYDEKYCYS